MKYKIYKKDNEGKRERLLTDEETNNLRVAPDGVVESLHVYNGVLSRCPEPDVYEAEFNKDVYRRYLMDGEKICFSAGDGATFSWNTKGFILCSWDGEMRLTYPPYREVHIDERGFPYVEE